MNRLLRLSMQIPGQIPSVCFCFGKFQEARGGGGGGEESSIGTELLYK